MQLINNLRSYAKKYRTAAALLALLILAASGQRHAAAAPAYPVHFVLSADSLPVREGAAATFQVSLDGEPAGNVTLVVERILGDSDLTVSSGTTINITRGAWATPRTVAIKAAEDPDKTNGTATFRVRESSANGIAAVTLPVTEQDNDTSHFVADVDALPVPEGGTALLRVWLADAPTTDVTFTVTRFSGDADLSVSAGSPGTIPAASWNSPAGVTIAAAADPDKINGTAVFRIHATNYTLPDLDVTARELDTDAAATNNVGGTLAADANWTTTTKDLVITSTVVVPAGKTLTIGPGVTLRQGSGGFIPFDVSGTLRIQNGARLILYTSTPAWYDTGSRRSAIILESGGVGDFDRAWFQAMELSDQSGIGPDEGDAAQPHWAAIVYATDNSRLTARGCRFEGLGRGEGWLPPYGLRMDGAAAVEVTDATTATSPVRTAWRNLRAGIGWVAGAGAKRVELCSFVNCPVAGVHIWGNLQQSAVILNNPDNLAASMGNTNLVVKNGATLTLAPGAGLRTVADRWVSVETGGRLVFNHAQAAMSCPIQVNGRLDATDSTIRSNTRTPAWYDTGSRRSGLIVDTGAVAVLERVLFQSYETSDQSTVGVDADGQTAWAAMVFATGTGSATLRGCRFENLPGVNGWKTPVGLRMASTATVVVEDSTTTSPAVRSSFHDYQAGIEWEAGSAGHRVEVCDFDACGRNIRIWGDSQANVTVNNVNTVLGTHNGSHLAMLTGTKLILNPGSKLLTRNWKTISIAGGAQMTATRAALDLQGQILAQGAVALTSTTLAVQSYAPAWYEAGSRQDGLLIQNGGAATLRNCSCYFYETSDRCYWSGGDPNWQEWAALIEAQAGSTLTLDHCALNAAPTPQGRLTIYGVRASTKVNVAVTNNVFADNYAALAFYDMAATRLVSGNEFRDSALYAIFNQTATPLAATDSYWGDPSGPAHMTNPGGTGGAISDGVGFGNARIAPALPLVLLAPPAAGQESNALGAAKTVLGAELFAVQATAGGAPLNQITFRLSGAASGAFWNKFANFRLALDANANGAIDASETVNVGGRAILLGDGNDLLVTFADPFTPPTGARYVLLADLDNINAGDAFTASLDARFLRTRLTAGIESRLGAVRHAAGSGVILLADPSAGQMADRLGGLPEQNDVTLFALRLLGAGGTVDKIDFQLSAVQDIGADKMFNVRLYEDVNKNGTVDGADRLVTSAPLALSFNTSNATGVITFTPAAAAMPTGRNYLLVANLRNLMAGDALTVGLAPANVLLTGGATVADGWTTPARHVVDSPVLLAPSPWWAPPANFGASSKNIPILGFQLIPTGRTINSLTIGLSSVIGIAPADLANARLYWDRNSNGVIDAGEPLLAGGGKVALSGRGGAITFTGPFTTRGDLIVQADIAGLSTGDELTASLGLDGISVPAGWLLSGATPPVRLVVGSGPEEGSNKNMKWTLAWRSPGGTAVSGRFNHAGDRVILGYDTGSAWIYDAASNTPLVMLKDHYDKVRYAGFSSDDSAAVTVSRDGAVYIWDLKTSGTLRSAMFSDLLVEYAVPSPDFRKLMVITEGKGMLLDIDTQQRLWEFTPGNATVNAIAYSPDGGRILLGSSDKRAYLLDANTGLQLASLTGHSQGVTGVAFTGDGQTLMTASSDATVQLWRYNTSLKRWMVARSITLTGQNAQGAAVSNDGQRVCMVTGGGSSALMRVFDGSTGLELFAINLTNVSGGNWGGILQNVTFDDSGQRILVTSTDNQWGQTACFRVSDGAWLGTWGPQGRFNGDYEMRPRVSGDGASIFYNTNWGMNLLSRQVGKTIRRSPNLPGDWRFAIDKAGSRLAWVQSGRLRVDAVNEGGFAQAVNTPFSDWNNVPVSLMPDASKVAVGDRLFSAKTGALFANSADTDGAYPSACSNDGMFWGYALSGNQALVTLLADDPTATQWSMTLTNPYTPFKFLYHPDGARIGCVDRGTGVQMYDMNQDGLPVGLYRFDAGDINDAALSEDGSLLLIGGMNVVKLYDVRTGAILRYFYPQHSSLQNVRVCSVAFVKNDSQLAIAWSYNYVEIYERSQAKSLEVTPATRTLAKGQSQPFQVELVYDDTTRRDVTPREGQTDTSVTLEAVPASAATIAGNVVTVAAAAPASFIVRARYREGGQTLAGQAVVTVGTAALTRLAADPDKMALTPGVFRPIGYTAWYSDGYSLDVTAQVTLAADRPEGLEISGQNVKMLFTAQPGLINVTGVYRDPLGAQASAVTTIQAFGPRTEWERYGVTGGGYGLCGAFSPSGAQLAAGSSSGAINLYKVGATPTQYSLTHVIMAHVSPLVYVGYLDNASDQLVSAAENGEIKTWSASAPTSQPLSVYQHDAQIQCASLICAGGARTLAVGDSLGRVSLIDLVAGRALWTVKAHNGLVRGVALDGDTVLSGGDDGHLKIYSQATGAVTATKTVHTKAIVAVGFMTVNNSPGFYTLGADNTLVRWTKANLAITGKPYEYPSTPTAAAVLGGTLYVATSSPPATWAYNSDGLLLRWLEHPPDDGTIASILGTPDGSYLVIGRTTGKKSVKLSIMGADLGSIDVTSPFSSFQFFEAGRGIYRGSLAHSFPLSRAHAAADGLTVYTQDPKRTMSWTLSNNAQATATRLMETGYFIAPSFQGLDFTENSSLLATRVDVSIYMYDTVHNLLWKTLHTPGSGPFTISPAGTRLASADSKTRLWDLANLSMIDENPHLCSGMHFVGENTFLGAIESDRFLGIFDSRNIMVNGVTTRHSPQQVHVNRAGTRAIIISYEVHGSDVPIYDYYAEVYNIANLANEPQLMNDIYLFTLALDPFSGASLPAFTIATSEDASLALIGATGDRPVRLVQLSDGTTIKEFMPPTGHGDRHIGAAAVEFLPGDRGAMLAWGEGYAELWRRVLPLSLSLAVDPLGGSAGPGAQKILAAPNTRIKVVPGQVLRIESSAFYKNGDNLNVTPTTFFSTYTPTTVFIDGSVLTISPKATPQVVTVFARYTELGQALTAQVDLEIVGSPITITGVSRAGYAADLLDKGKALYVDAASTFTQPLPGSLLHQYYIRTKAADGGATGDGFLQFTVSQNVRVIVAVDGRMTRLPAWLKTWTEITEQLRTTDASPTRRLFQRYFAKGVVSLGANRDADSNSGMRMYDVIITSGDVGQTGSVRIQSNAPAPWRLDGPGQLMIQDAGTTTIVSQPTGSYLINWLPLPWWDSPEVTQGTAYLASGTQVLFTGAYTRQAGLVTVHTVPAGAPWRLINSAGGVINGKGSATLPSVAAGPLTFVWQSLDGYDGPPVTTVTQTLPKNGQVDFAGIYLAQADSNERNRNRLLQYLLGLVPLESWWMDANGDNQVDINDILYLRKNAQPLAPALLTPAAGATGVATTVTFDWSDSKYAQSYDFYLWKQSDYSSTPLATGLKTSTYKPSAPLTAKTSYSWFVKAHNSVSDTWSNTGSFTTK